jgi:DNA-binding IclR family transcriptional regulator
MKAGAENYTIQTVSLALDLLEQFQENDGELGILDMCKRLNLKKNIVFRLAATLEAKDYLEMNSFTGTYRLGIMTRVLGLVASRQIDYAIQARPFLDGIKRQCHESCYFSVIKDGYTYYLDGVETDLPVRVVQRVGFSRPLYCTAAGKVQLAFLEPHKRIGLLSGSGFSRLSSVTITDHDELHDELNKVAQKGYAIDDQGYDPGVMEIAAPVFGSNGAIFGALSIVGPTMRLEGNRCENELLPLVCQNAIRLSHALGQLPLKSDLQQSQTVNSTKAKR